MAEYLGEGTDPFPWQYVYLGIALAGLALVALTSAAVGPFGTLSETTVALALVGTLFVVAVAHAVVWVRGRGYDPPPTSRGDCRSRSRAGLAGPGSGSVPEPVDSSSSSAP